MTDFRNQFILAVKSVQKIECGNKYCDKSLIKRMSKSSCSSNPDSAFVGFANLPNQVHRKIAKRGFEFTLMVMGASGLGKSTLINSLFLTDLYPEREIIPAQKLLKATVEIDASTVEIEERGVKVRLTLVDTPGFGDALDSKNCHQPIVEYIEKQFEKYLKDESGLNRRNISDNRVHCLFYFISPFCKGMRALDIECLKFLHNRVNIVPIIGKADALMPAELAFLKRRILEQLKENNIKIYEIPVCDDEDDDNEFREQNKRLREAVPFAVCGSAETYEIKGRKIRGRMYPWGLVDIENKDHCDFIKLRTMLITHMQDLQEITHEVHYENFRSERLNRREQSDKILQEKEEELRAVHEMLAKMKAEMAAKS